MGNTTKTFEQKLNPHNRGNVLADAQTPTRGWKRQHFHKVNGKCEKVDEPVSGYTFGVWGIGKFHGDWNIYHLPTGRSVVACDRKRGWTLSETKKWAHLCASYVSEDGLTILDVEGLEKVRITPSFRSPEDTRWVYMDQQEEQNGTD